MVVVWGLTNFFFNLSFCCLDFHFSGFNIQKSNAKVKSFYKTCTSINQVFLHLFISSFVCFFFDQMKKNKTTTTENEKKKIQFAKYD